MLVQIIDKQRHAVNVVKTALLSVGIRDRSVCVQINSPNAQYDEAEENYSVFVSAPNGAHIEPFYVTGKTLAGAVKNVISSIKTANNSAMTEESEIAPF